MAFTLHRTILLCWVTVGIHVVITCPTKCPYTLRLVHRKKVRRYQSGDHCIETLTNARQPARHR